MSSDLLQRAVSSSPMENSLHGPLVFEDVVLKAEAVNVFYGEKQAVFDVNLEIPRKKVVAFIGPSGCGKSTLLRCFNRMNDVIDTCRVEGLIGLEGQDITSRGLSVEILRKRVGMVFQKSNPFPMSIQENIAFGPRLAGEKNQKVLKEITERCLRGAHLWHEVKDRLDSSALDLSGGQQQRVCIARALAMNPEVLLMDEPCSALDPIATQQIEKLIYELKQDYSIIIVTHNMQQAARVSDYTAFMNMGELVEYSETKKMFTNPSQQKTEDYITGRFG